MDEGDHIGHPSCEGGRAVGTHLHIARKYNGEWVGAGGALPFVLSGWTTHEGETSTHGITNQRRSNHYFKLGIITRIFNHSPTGRITISNDPEIPIHFSLDMSYY